MDRDLAAGRCANTRGRSGGRRASRRLRRPALSASPSRLIHPRDGPAYPGPVPADHALPSLFDHLPSRPTYEDLERLAARMRDIVGARLDLGLLQPRNWACGVRRRGGFRWIDPGF